MEQKYIIKNMKSFQIDAIFDCGQCFRWNKQSDGSYIGVINNNVIQVVQNSENIIFLGECTGKLQEICNQYFDLDRNYEEIKEKLSRIDKYMESSIKYGVGIRILNQNLWEMIISFIISANNNIPRIKKIIEAISKKYGNKIIFNQKEYYTFPTIEQLKDVSIQEFREIGLGFRDKYVFGTIEYLNKHPNFEKEISLMETVDAKKELMKLPGVGPKVADCILLFSTLKRFDVFPADVWIRRVMNELYIHEKNEEKVSKVLIDKISKQKFGDLRGIAQQYLYYWKRDGEDAK